MQTSRIRRCLAVGAGAATALGIVPLAAVPASAAPAELFFSEYVEGSSNNKALEIYNGTDSAVDLSGYRVEVYFNGATEVGLTLGLTGTVASHDVHVVAHSSAAAAILEEADTTSGAGLWNGDDAIVLRVGDTVIDSIGQVGADPGSEWGSGDASTQDNTLRRKASIGAADTDPTDVFDPAVQWEGFPQDTFDGLGSYTGEVVDEAPEVDSTIPLDGAVSVPEDQVLSVTFSEDVVLAPGAFTLHCDGVAVPVTIHGGPRTFTVDPDAPLTSAADCVLTIEAGAVTDLDGTADPMEADVSVDFFVASGDVCADEFTPIYEIQGSGDTAATTGPVTTEGVVTGDFEGDDGLNGFYIQDPTGDGEEATSDGIFVFNGSDDEVQEGDLVRVSGNASDRFGQTQISAFDDGITVCGEGTVEPTVVSLPFPSLDARERYEGMLITFTDDLVISEYFNYDRFGEVVLALPPNEWDRLHTPTAVVEPGDAATDLAADYELRKILVDDGRDVENPDTVPHPGNGEPFSLDNRFRGGDTVTGITGVLGYGFSAYRLQPTEYGEYTVENPRPEDAPEVGGDVTVASFNVLNYFLTLDAGGDAEDCGPADNRQECRGADTEEEFERQRDKLLAALHELDADVVGLMEMENTPGVEPAADLAAGLNEMYGADVYDYIDTGVIGDDVIRVGFLYKPAVVQPVGDFAVLDSSVDPVFNDEENRPMLTQTFEEVATGARFTVSVNHLKSKGSDCDDLGDPDIGDGQGNCNLTRVQAARAIVEFLASDPTDSGDPDHLIIGDLNSYDHEDPIDVLLAAGYTDLIKKYSGELAYGYVFDGMVGYLDHALSSPTLTPQVTGAQEWHINADEPDILDYDMSFKPDPLDALYEPNFYRSSDHDPVLVGLDLVADASPEQCYADGAQRVESYDPGPRVNGTPVPRGHTKASQALGISGRAGNGPSWVTLGINGEIVLEFANLVRNNNGSEADLRIVDVRDGGKGRADTAAVFASLDGSAWVEVGVVNGTGEVDLGSLAAARYVKVVDQTSTKGKVNPATDGFDLDAVEVLSGCVA